MQIASQYDTYNYLNGLYIHRANEDEDFDTTRSTASFQKVELNTLEINYPSVIVGICSKPNCDGYGRLVDISRGDFDIQQHLEFFLECIFKDDELITFELALSNDDLYGTPDEFARATSFLNREAQRELVQIMRRNSKCKLYYSNAEKVVTIAESKYGHHLENGIYSPANPAQIYRP